VLGGQLWERDGVVGAVVATLDKARTGAGSALFIVSEAGLGKTSVLEEAKLLAAPDFEVSVGCGEEMERAVPFGLAIQLGACQPVR